MNEKPPQAEFVSPYMRPQRPYESDPSENYLIRMAHAIGRTLIAPFRPKHGYVLAPTKRGDYKNTTEYIWR